MALFFRASPVDKGSIARAPAGASAPEKILSFLDPQTHRFSDRKTTLHAPPELPQSAHNDFSRP